jgi:hypothetical protein
MCRCLRRTSEGVRQDEPISQQPRIPRCVIFASSEKPDIRLGNAVSNDIEIVTNADKVLVYDRPIDHNG